jgi:predicted porin
MNKKLLALAIAGASVAPAAWAQTANPVTLYGRAYVTLESIEAKGNPGVARRNRVQDNSSLLGVRGTEDLGGGLKAFFQLETSFRLDSNDSTFANRNSGVGLQGRFGSFLMGRWDMPFKVATIAVDPFGDLTIGGITVANNDQGNFDRRDQNVVQYWSPNFGGLTVRLAGTANEGKTATTNPRDYGASVQFTRGPMYLFYAYEEHRDPSATVKKEDGNAFGGSFTFGAFKVGGLYEQFKRDAVAAPGFHKRKSYLANVVYTMGSHQFIYQFQNSEGGNRQNATNTAAQAECDVNSVGYQYNFTRRTFFLAQYVTVDNNETANCGSSGGSFGMATAGMDPRGVSFGIRHVF